MSFLDTHMNNPQQEPHCAECMPTATCPKCRAEVVDFDGFGVLAHLKPDGCGYCSHPSRDDGVCGICGDVRR